MRRNKEGVSIIKKNPLIFTTAEEAFRPRATLWVTVTTLILLIPFAIYHFMQQHHLLGIGSLIVAIVVSVTAWKRKNGDYNPRLTFVLLVPPITLFLGLNFHTQGMIGALWSYPAISAFYFLLPEHRAWLANTLLLFITVPQSWYVFDPAIAGRVTATLLATSLFSAIFVRVINSQQRRLERNDVKRRDAMASLSHELRTPLSTLTAQVEAMLDGIRPLDNTQLLALSRSMNHFNELIDDLYQLAQADDGTLICRKELTSWDTVIHASIKAVDHQLRHRDLKLTVKLDKNVMIEGDSRRLRRIMDNLLENCRRFTASGAAVDITLQKHEQVAELTISDSAPGVNDDVLESLFDRFYRADGSRSRINGGTGLGLSLVKALAEAHNGHVSAFHSPLGGLGIRITLPLGNVSRSFEIHPE